jgi:hypothetical protein
MVFRPLEHIVEIPALMPGVEIRIWARIILHPLMSDDTDVGMALYELPKHFNTVHFKNSILVSRCVIEIFLNLGWRKKKQKKEKKILTHVSVDHIGFVCKFDRARFVVVLKDTFAKEVLAELGKLSHYYASVGERECVLSSVAGD